MPPAQYSQTGYHVARNLLDANDIKTIRDTFMHMNRTGPVEGLSETSQSRHYQPSDPLSFYPRMMHPHRHMDKPVGPVATKYMLLPALHDILRDLFDDEPLAVQSMFYFKPPGARGQELHQDDFYLRTKPGICMAAWMAIDDADEDNGGLFVVPGTHEIDVACPQQADPTRSFSSDYVAPPPGTKPVPVNLKAGDVMFFGGRLIHGSSPNTSTTRFRRAMIYHYVPEHSSELSRWYEAPRRFDGTVVKIPEAIGGGPCGTGQASVLH